MCRLAVSRKPILNEYNRVKRNFAGMPLDEVRAIRPEIGLVTSIAGRIPGRL